MIVNTIVIFQSIIEYKALKLHPDSTYEDSLYFFLTAFIFFGTMQQVPNVMCKKNQFNINKDDCMNNYLNTANNFSGVLFEYLKG